MRNLINLEINGMAVSAEPGSTLLESANFYGVEIPTLCYMEGLSPYGGCRLCMVEVGAPGKSRLVAACSHPVREGLRVKTHTERVMKHRRLLLELYLATCPSSKQLQDLASKHHVTQVRFKPRHQECILCGLCVRMCREQMMGKAIGFVDRGVERRIATPFDKKSEDCRLCGGCMYVCPACQARCQGPQEKSPVCNACLNLYPPCVEQKEEALCYLDPCVACEMDSARART